MKSAGENDKGLGQSDQENTAVPGRSKNLDEIALSVGCQLHERAAFHELVRRFSALVHVIASKVIEAASRDISLDADDLTERFFLDVWQSPQQILGNFDPIRGSLGTYLKNIATRRCQRMLRSHTVNWPARRPSHDANTLERIPERSSTPFDSTKFIARLLAKLSERSRSLVEARFGLRLESVGELAQTVGMSKAKAYRHIATVIRQRLRPIAYGMDPELD
jgi:RNA polymerase sigma factor (sigma-70 family)